MRQEFRCAPPARSAEPCKDGSGDEGPALGGGRRAIAPIEASSVLSHVNAALAARTRRASSQSTVRAEL